MKRVLSGVVLFLCLMGEVFAHNVVSGVYADGLVIEGEIGFSNGDMAQAGFTVEVFDASGSALGTTKTQEGGTFTFNANSVQKHVFKVDLGAGHVANMVLDADELTEGVEVSTDIIANKPDDIAMAKPTGQSSPQVIISGTSISAEELQSLIRGAVAQQIRPLQKEIRAYKEKVFFRDITGGLGFIFGLFGVAAWATSRRKETQS